MEGHKESNQRLCAQYFARSPSTQRLGNFNSLQALWDLALWKTATMWLRTKLTG